MIVFFNEKTGLIIKPKTRSLGSPPLYNYPDLHVPNKVVFKWVQWSIITMLIKSFSQKLDEAFK